MIFLNIEHIKYLTILCVTCFILKHAKIGINKRFKKVKKGEVCI